MVICTSRVATLNLIPSNSFIHFLELLNGMPHKSCTGGSTSLRFKFPKSQLNAPLLLCMIRKFHSARRLTSIMVVHFSGELKQRRSC